MRFTPTLFSLLGVANLGLASPLSDTTGGTGLKVTGGALPYPLEPFTFKGNIGGHDIAYIKKTYPDFDAANFKAVHADGPGTSVSPRSVLERTANNKEKPGQCCDAPQMKGHNWKYVSTTSVNNAIGKLKKYDRCQVNARTCRCLMHVGNACIHLCNDNNYSIDPSCGYLATYASDLNSYCVHADTFDGVNYIYSSCGQMFDTDGYNVVISETK